MKTILVSAGHSDEAPGIVANLWREADLAERFRDQVAALLRADGVPVLTDGNVGINRPLREAIALQARAQIFVEFHFNAPPRREMWDTATGIEALATTAQKKLSQALCAAIHSQTGLRLRGDAGHKLPNSGAHSTLGFCKAGGIILECCFLTNRGDLALWLKHEVATARAVADALKRFAQDSSL